MRAAPGLVIIAFGKEFFASLERVQLPSGQLVIAFGKEFLAFLERLQLPSGRQAVGTGKESFERLERVRLLSRSSTCRSSPSARSFSRSGSACCS